MKGNRQYWRLPTEPILEVEDIMLLHCEGCWTQTESDEDQECSRCGSQMALGPLPPRVTFVVGKSHKGRTTGKAAKKSERPRPSKGRTSPGSMGGVIRPGQKDIKVQGRRRRGQRPISNEEIWKLG